MMSIDEALSTVIGATYTSWIEHRTESGSWSRRQHQKTRRILEPAQVRYLVKNPLPGEKRRHLRPGFMWSLGVFSTPNAL